MKYSIVNDLENDLIDPSEWLQYYKSMPNKCKEVVDSFIDEPECIGIGYNDYYGWFIMGSGQGPSLLWNEKQLKNNKQ